MDDAGPTRGTRSRQQESSTLIMFGNGVSAAEVYAVTYASFDGFTRTGGLLRRYLRTSATMLFRMYAA